MYKVAVVVEGNLEELEEFAGSIGTSRQPLSPRKVIKPPSSKEIARDYRKNKQLPKNLAEWKRRYWGTEKINETTLRRDGEGQMTLLFSADSSPEPLLEEISKQRVVRAAMLWGPGTVVFRGKRAWRGQGNVLDHTDELHRLGLLDFLQGEIRVPAMVWDKEGLEKGRAVRTRVLDRSLTLQRDLLGDSRADLVLDDTSPLDDVLPAWRNGLCLWLDLEK